MFSNYFHAMEDPMGKAHNIHNRNVRLRGHNPENQDGYNML